MGIRFSATAKVLKSSIEKFVQVTGEVWKNFNQAARLYSSSGDDSPPCDGDQIILVKIDGTGKYIVSGVLTVSQGAKPGEKILFARDADAAIVSKIAMLNDGSVTLDAKDKLTLKSEKEVEINGNTTITGGELICNGTASPNGTGCLCAKPFCLVDGSPQSSNKATGT